MIRVYPMCICHGSPFQKNMVTKMLLLVVVLVIDFFIFLFINVLCCCCRAVELFLRSFSSRHHPFFPFLCCVLEHTDSE
jgi:hypothetical protein